MAGVDLRPRVHATTVVQRRELAPDVVLLTLEAPELAAATRPGQYVMAIPPSAQAAATALAIYEAEGKLASILFFVTGKRTRELSELHPGDRLDVVGPLGNGFDCSGDARDVAIVAGGVGIASVLLCALALLERGARVRLFYGARTGELLVDAQRFEDAGCELVLTTDDGTRGQKGFVHRNVGAFAQTGSNLRVRSVADVARCRAHCRRVRRARAARARRDVRMRSRRLLGMRRSARGEQRASAEFPAG